MVRIYIHLMEQSFHVTGESNGFFTKATENSDKTGIEKDMDFVPFLQVVNAVMGYILNATIGEVTFLVQNPLSLSLVNHVLREGFVVFLILPLLES